MSGYSWITAFVLSSFVVFLFSGSHCTFPHQRRTFTPYAIYLSDLQEVGCVIVIITSSTPPPPTYPHTPSLTTLDSPTKVVDQITDYNLID
jgi:hypothetical protein